MTAPETKPRPTVVTAAAALSFLIAVLAVVNVVLSLTTMSGYADKFKSEALKHGAAADQVDQAVKFTNGFTLGGLALGLAFAVALVVLGMQVLRGKQGARIGTWVVAGLVLLCGVCILAGSAIGSGMGGGDASQKAISDAAIAAQPGWYGAWTTVAGIVDLLGAVAIIVLLALPAANAY